MKRTTPWRQSLVFLPIRTTRPSPCRRCQRRPRPASCPALWTSSWTTTWWTWSNLETACRSLGATAACRARREASPQARSGEAFKYLFCQNSRLREPPPVPFSHFNIAIFYSTFVLRTIMIACNIKQMSKEVSPIFSPGDIAKIRNFARSKVGLNTYAYIWAKTFPTSDDLCWSSGCV